jgi:hypothetical protein
MRRNALLLYGLESKGVARSLMGQYRAVPGNIGHSRNIHNAGWDRGYFSLKIKRAKIFAGMAVTTN